MGFGKKASKEHTPHKKVKENNNDVKHNKKIDETDIVVDNTNNNIINSIDNNVDIVISQMEKTKLKFKRKDLGIKKNKLVMFGQSNEEKLELFIDNLKRNNPNIPGYFFSRDIEKFKQKLGE